MKEKIVKSYILLGNLPIYKKDKGSDEPGYVSPVGCDFVINTRIKYELGVCTMQFIRQTHPSTYNINNSNFNEEIEMDLSSLIRLKRIISYYVNGKSNCSPVQTGNQYIQLTSTKTLKNVEFQKSCFFTLSDHSLLFTMDNKKQELFKISGSFQIESFLDLLEVVINTLPDAYTRYDLFKNHENAKTSNQVFGQYVPPPVEGPLPNTITTPFIVEPNTKLGSAIPCNIPPAPVTDQIIPQAPAFEIPAPPQPIN